MLNDWYSLGDCQYRKWHIYDMEWQISSNHLELENYLVCGSPFAGPVAMILDSKRNTSLPENVDKKKLLIFTSSGIKLSEIEWVDRSVVGMGWTDLEQLIVVSEDGSGKLFDLHGKLIIEFNLIDGGKNSTTILECHFWGNGVAALTADLNIKVAEGLAQQDIKANPPRIYGMPTKLGSDRTHTSMAIISPSVSKSGVVEVLLGTSNKSILVIHEEGNETVLEDQMLQQMLSCPITKISVSPDGSQIACYKKDGVLTVMSTAFNQRSLDFDTKSASRPITLQWCGKDAIILQWKNTGLVMVGKSGDWINFPYDTSGIHIVAEIDCCRIITSHSCEILQLIPNATIAALEIGSTDPAALIIDAMEAFEEGDPKSDENIRIIAAANQLTEAVTSCIQAASYEFFPSQQQRLLKAASYGKVFCPDLDPNEFVETAKKLRILNDVRRKEIGMPLTIQQYNRLTPEVLLGRLTVRNYHFLALKIAELLHYKNERILIHWASEKIKKLHATNLTITDEAINEIIRKQLSPYGKISYLAIAEVAYSIGRRQLATLILEQEKQPHDQIPLLLRMNEEELALQKAIATDDTDLIYYTIISLQNKFLLQSNSSNSSGSGSGGSVTVTTAGQTSTSTTLTPQGATSNNTSQTQTSQSTTTTGIENFYKILLHYPEAMNLLKCYYKQKMTSQDRSWIHQLLLIQKQYVDCGHYALQQSLVQYQSVDQMTLLKEANTFYHVAKHTIDGNFFKQQIDEQMELMNIQAILRTRSNTSYPFEGLSVMETLRALIQLAAESHEESRWIDQEVPKFIKKFKISEKSIYYLKIECYSELHDWSSLYKFAMERKSPIGYRPFALACLKHAASDGETERYIDKITIPEDKYELYMKIKSYQKACDVANKLRDPYRLQEVGRVCQDPALERQIQDMLAKI